MAEQALDLKATVALLRRRRGALAGAAALGGTAGVLILVLLLPPMYSSTSQVLLPTARPSTGEAATRDIATQISIAESDAVLGEAGRSLRPPVSLRTLQRHVDVVGVTDDILEISARADSAAGAEGIARAVAAAEVAYVEGSAGSLSDSERAALGDRRASLEQSLRTVESEIAKTTTRIETAGPARPSGSADAAALARLTAEQAHLVLQIDEVQGQLAGAAQVDNARIIQKATPGEKPDPVAAFGLSAAIGGGAGVLLTAVLVHVSGRRDRRLRYRDDLADALGSVVIGSVLSRVPKTVAGWATLLETYAPSPRDALAMERIHRRLELTSESRTSRFRSVTVVCLSGDPRALSVGPLIASHAASAGLSTRLAVSRAPESAAGLWAACAQYADDVQPRPGLSVQLAAPVQEFAGLTVVVAVVDRQRPDLADSPRTSCTIVAVSPGAATADELATLALATEAAGLPIDGVVVADPDDLDHTTGRLPLQQREQQVPLPTRLTGLPSHPPRSPWTATPRRSP